MPRKYTAFTPCYRREAGSYGKDTRGFLRQHQFDKVELVKLAAPETAYDELEAMVGDAERVLQRLGLAVPRRAALHRRHGLRVGQDLRPRGVAPRPRGATARSPPARTARPSRRAAPSLRYRPAGGGKLEYLHTLNGSGLAVGRTLIAVLENYQEADGTVVVPEALRPYLDGRERLSPA